MTDSGTGTDTLSFVASVPLIGISTETDSLTLVVLFFLLYAGAAELLSVIGLAPTLVKAQLVTSVSGAAVYI